MVHSVCFIVSMISTYKLSVA